MCGGSWRAARGSGFLLRLRGVLLFGRLVFLLVLRLLVLFFFLLFHEQFVALLEDRVEVPFGHHIDPLLVILLGGEFFAELLGLVGKLLVEPGLVLGFFILARGALLGERGGDGEL